MERIRKDREGGVLTTVAELFDLPADVVAGLPRLEMVGSRQLYLEHHTGILSYSDQQIDANTAGGVLRVKGDTSGHDGGRAADRRTNPVRGVGEVRPW